MSIAYVVSSRASSIASTTYTAVHMWQQQSQSNFSVHCPAELQGTAASDALHTPDHTCSTSWQQGNAVFLKTACTTDGQQQYVLPEH
jgi:hypothetical protein